MKNQTHGRIGSDLTHRHSYFKLQSSSFFSTARLIFRTLSTNFSCFLFSVSSCSKRSRSSLTYSISLNSVCDC